MQYNDISALLKMNFRGAECSSKSTNGGYSALRKDHFASSVFSWKRGQSEVKARKEEKEMGLFKKENPMVSIVNRLLKNAQKDLKESKEILKRVQATGEESSLEEVIEERLRDAAKKLGKSKTDLEPFGKLQILVKRVQKVSTEEDAEELLKKIFASGEDFLDFLTIIDWQKERQKIEEKFQKAEK